MAWAGLGTDYQDAATLLKNRAKPVPHQLYEYQTWLFLKITSNLSISRKYGSVMNDPYRLALYIVRLVHNSIVVVVSTFKKLRHSALVVLVLAIMRWGKSSTDSENTKKYNSYKESTGRWAKLHTGNIHLMRAVVNWPQQYLNQIIYNLVLLVGTSIFSLTSFSTWC